MKTAVSIFLLFTTSVFSLPAWSSSCEDEASQPKPDWVSQHDYGLADSYVAIGVAEKDGKTKSEQLKASENHARQQLVEQIEVTIKSESSKSTAVNNRAVQQEASTIFTVRAEEVLRDLKIKDHWLDKNTCSLYTLIAISKASVAQTKREKIMRGRVDRIKILLADGADRDKVRDVKTRRKNLEEAQTLLTDTDFNLLTEELSKEHYARRIELALASNNNEISQSKGRMALFALNKDASLRADLIGKMLDHLRANDNASERLMDQCAQEQECISIAKDRGFTKLTMLKASSQVGISMMGAYKGTLTVSRTVYDLDSRKVLKGPDSVSAQTIGWSLETLDWDAAVDKAMRDLK